MDEDKQNEEGDLATRSAGAGGRTDVTLLTAGFTKGSLSCEAHTGAAVVGIRGAFLRRGENWPAAGKRGGRQDGGRG